MILINQEKIVVLERAKELLLTKGWAQGTSARDKDGNEVFVLDERASCYCLFGALVKSLEIEPKWSRNDPLMNEIHGELKKRGYPTYSKFNDNKNRKVEEVVAFVDNMIDLYKKESVYDK